ncbi:TMEM165/GDT1 family protein [Cyanobium sp. T1G-Tous]|jgi:putative Ca2+/H+ antiporter (TMEM165/GDT1 family)|uniref:TMEM165/GDT1 family protein n=1 Tax=unclassified Cyanobium TaxID=2627006 RepID=UPI0020CDF896|nr:MULTISPECIES: TMEM165/GDT1 family protein [unclassified Cyanobium]MCP9778065.1 TMEM165/GDT1 family protein [Cyanobium sp. Tous-M-B4]MCP9802823.1 TMEM165/GDT1 family protein [Cyanobium sp. T1G-Tous]MCP9875037.1 TMEM165/GDT1 family protein [Cyanobium sp. A2C-AMD]
MAPPLSSDPSLAAFGSSLTAITLAELGDKTFFMALILAVRHRARWVFIGSFAALTAVTLISLALGYGLRELLPQSLVPWLAAVLFLSFGIKLLIDAQGMAANAATEEKAEAEQAINTAESSKAFNTAWAVIWEAFVLVFIAELGDRTQFTTIFMATAPAQVFSFGGLLAGTLLGHALVTWLAVGAGKWIGQWVNERLLYRLSGGLFLVFGLAALSQALS